MDDLFRIGTCILDIIKKWHHLTISEVVFNYKGETERESDESISNWLKVVFTIEFFSAVDTKIDLETAKFLV